MKKILLTAVLSACILLAACKKDEAAPADEKMVNGGSVSETSARDSSEPEKETSVSDGIAADDNGLADSVLESAAESNADSESGNNQTAGNTPINDSSQSEGNAETDNSDVIALGREQFEKSCRTQWNFIVNCPYELDYGSSTGTGAFLISDAGVSGINDIVNQYCEVFLEPDDTLYGKYFESGGDVYCYDGGRGANIYYTGTDLSLVSQSEERLVFNAVSHYSGGESAEKTNEFSMVKVDGEWKTESFTMPY